MYFIDVFYNIIKWIFTDKKRKFLIVLIKRALLKFRYVGLIN